MNRRAFVGLLTLPALAGLGGWAYSALARRRNPYYAGPVTDHFDGLRFFTPGAPQDRGALELLRWHLGGGREPWPEVYPSPFHDRPPPRVAGLRVAMIGHASVLIQVAGLNILVDPVFAERASPLSFAGPRRVNPPGIDFAALPPIDAVLVTHNHYDHMDVEALARLWREHRPRIVAPLGKDAIIRAHDPAIQVEVRDWGGSVALSGEVTAHLEPALHWSARGINDRRMALWGGYVLTSPQGALYSVGDTGYSDGAIFRAIREKHGSVRLALIPIGAYEPRWFMKTQHVNPEEAVQIMLDCGAAQALGVHWGSFRLTNEGVEQPAQALAAALAARGIPPERFRALRPGEVWEASPPA